MVKEWLSNHVLDPYPTAAEKDHFAQSLGLESKQISTLFNNVRKRHTKCKVSHSLLVYCVLINNDKSIPLLEKLHIQRYPRMQ
jgi:hypothetical protein